MTAANPTSPSVRDDYVPKDDYISREFLERETEKLWPKVWQVACREEEIPNVGDVVAYEIIDESVIIVRTAPDEIRAYYNVCPHRGRRIVDGPGHVAQFMCKFHGWQWKLDGSTERIVDEQDWGNCLTREDTDLIPVKVGTWGGFVYINMDDEAEPLEEYLKDVIERCDKFEFEKLRYRWYKTVIYPCNWKVAVEAFNEAYHVQATHPQMLRYIQDYSVSGEYGVHSAFWYPPLDDGQSRFEYSSRLGEKPHSDYRQYVLEYFKEMHEQLEAMVTPRSYEAAQRLRNEVPADAPAIEVLMKLREFQREAAIQDGAGWPEELTPEYVAASRVDWHVFPNQVFLHSSVDGIICYRARPNGHDPNSCIFDIWSLVRYAPGKAPPLNREFYPEWKAHKWGRILMQDFGNMEQVQKGMRSRAFKGARPNPKQERAVSNFHRALHAFVDAADNG